VVVLRRPLQGEMLIAQADHGQGLLGFIEADRKTGKRTTGYEYAVLVSNLDHEILSLGQLYRDRADAENAFDELKNQWGVRPESRLDFCFTGQVRPDETGCSINRSLPRHAKPATAWYEALGTM
jgi:hypothetical protein